MSLARAAVSPFSSTDWDASGRNLGPTTRTFLRYAGIGCDAPPIDIAAFRGNRSLLSASCEQSLAHAGSCGRGVGVGAVMGSRKFSEAVNGLAEPI